MHRDQARNAVIARPISPSSTWFGAFRHIFLRFLYKREFGWSGSTCPGKCRKKFESGQIQCDCWRLEHRSPQDMFLLVLRFIFGPPTFAQAQLNHAFPSPGPKHTNATFVYFIKVFLELSENNCRAISTLEFFRWGESESSRLVVRGLRALTSWVWKWAPRPFSMKRHMFFDFHGFAAGSSKFVAQIEVPMSTKTKADESAMGNVCVVSGCQRKALNRSNLISHARIKSYLIKYAMNYIVLNTTWVSADNARERIATNLGQPGTGQKFNC